MTLRALVDAGLLALSTIALVPASVLFVQLIASTTRRVGARAHDPLDAAADVRATLAVLMPAHDEAAGITPAIHALMNELAPGDRLLVVADNCTDATASIARAAGAEVIERHDAQRRGKGYALDFGVRWLERDPPAIVVIVDADCIVAPHALSRLARQCQATTRPTQALYLMHAPAGAPLRMRVAEFAWLVKNKLRPVGSAALGGPCQLMGTGMAFPWALIRHAPLASGHLVEDMELGLALAGAGSAPMFCAEAFVSSVFPTDNEGVASQRTRWEHGHLSMIASVGPRMLWRAIVERNAVLAAMVLDLMVPPLASLVLLLSAVTLVDVLWWFSGGAATAFGIAALGMILLAVSVLAAWARDGRRLVSLRELMSLPWYVAAKIPVYVRLFTRRQVAWVRTKRDERPH